MNIQYNEYMTTREQIKAWILNKLKRHRYIGGKHTDIRNIRKGAPPEFYSEIDDATKELIRDGIVVVKITAYGKHVSLNPRLMKEINEFIQKNYTEVMF